MQQSESIDKLAPALAKAQAAFRPVGKSGENKFDRYAYATLEDYVKAVGKVLADHGFSLITSVEAVDRLEDRSTKNGGTEHAVHVKLVVRLVHESGQWIEGCGFGEGQDRADKSVYKAITGARKYALASMLGLATTDDPEGEEREPEGAAEPPTARPAANGKAKNARAPFSAGAKAALDALRSRKFDMDGAKAWHEWFIAECKGKPSPGDYEKFIADVLGGVFDGRMPGDPAVTDADVDETIPFTPSASGGRALATTGV